jgi:hypothetical protein
MQGGQVKRFVGREVRTFTIFAPFALAGNDALYIVPIDTLRRCIILELQRSARPLEQAEGEGFQAQCDLLVNKMRSWEVIFPLTPPAPQIPEQLDVSARDNWRPLLAIAEHLGKGAEARAAALALSARDEVNERILLLTHIRDLFAQNPQWDRITRDELVLRLHALEDSPWLAWHGPRTGGLRQLPQPHPLTARELVFVLGRFGLPPRNLWPPGGRQGRGRSQKGWYRDDLAPVWARYCPKPPPQPSPPPAPPTALPKPRPKSRNPARKKGRKR